MSDVTQPDPQEPQPEQPTPDTDPSTDGGQRAHEPKPDSDDDGADGPGTP